MPTGRSKEDPRCFTDDEAPDDYQHARTPRLPRTSLCSPRNTALWSPTELKISLLGLSRSFSATKFFPPSRGFGLSAVKVLSYRGFGGRPISLCFAHNRLLILALERDSTSTKEPTETLQSTQEPYRERQSERAKLTETAQKTYRAHRAALVSRP